MECVLSKTIRDTSRPEDSFWADWFIESALYGEVHVITNPADGGPPRVLRRKDYDITVTPKQKGEVVADSQ
jgi:hypothetical protein